MKAYTIFYYGKEIGREYGESAWQAIDDFCNRKEGYMNHDRKHIYAKPQGKLKHTKRKK